MTPIKPHFINRHRTYQIITDTTTYYINTSQNINDSTSITYITFDSSTNIDINLLNNSFIKNNTSTYLIITEDNSLQLPHFNDTSTFYIDSTTFFRDSKIYAYYL